MSKRQHTASLHPCPPSRLLGVAARDSLAPPVVVRCNSVYAIDLPRYEALAALSEGRPGSQVLPAGLSGSREGWATATNPALGTEDLEGPAGLKGNYKITKAAGPDGKSYEGTVTIAPKGDAFDVTWTLPTESYSGVGIQEGDLLVVGWGEAGKGAGVVSYKVSKNTLVGRWGAPGSDKLGTETLTKE